MQVTGSTDGLPLGAGRLVLASVVLLVLAMVTPPWGAAEAGAATAPSIGSFGAGRSGIAADEREPPPVTIRIGAAAVDALIEASEVEHGALRAPSGPWVVAWYRETARPGETGNVVMGGHVDYWGVGPAVFYGLGGLTRGAEIVVTDAVGTAYVYAVDWVKTFPAAELTPEQLRTIVGPTSSPSLTLITCGGAFDDALGQYLSRLVVRATRL